MDKFDVRTALPADKPAIQDLNVKSFGRPDEAQLITKLEQDGSVLIQLVAEMEGQIVGHCLFFSLGVRGKLGAIGLGPMCVDPWVQRSGIGTAMVNLGLNHIKNHGGAICFVLGWPDFYKRFGFTQEAAADFKSPWSGQAEFMAVRLRYGPPMSGELIYPVPFGVETA